MNEQVIAELQELFNLCLTLNELGENETFFDFCPSSNVAHIRVYTPNQRLDLKGKLYT